MRFLLAALFCATAWAQTLSFSNTPCSAEALASGSQIEMVLPPSFTGLSAPAMGCVTVATNLTVAHGALGPELRATPSVGSGLRVSRSGSVYTIALGIARYGFITNTFSAATLTESDPDDNGTIRFFVDYNAGNPTLACMIPATFTAANYTAVGMSACASGDAFPSESIPLAQALMTNGTPADPDNIQADQAAGPVIRLEPGQCLTSALGGRAYTLGLDVNCLPSGTPVPKAQVETTSLDGIPGSTTQITVMLTKTPAPNTALLGFLNCSQLCSGAAQAAAATASTSVTVVLPTYRPFTTADTVTLVYWTNE